jgi:hypothetical protein
VDVSLGLSAVPASSAPLGWIAERGRKGMKASGAGSVAERRVRTNSVVTPVPVLGDQAWLLAECKGFHRWTFVTSFELKLSQDATQDEQV